MKRFHSLASTAFVIIFAVSNANAALMYVGNNGDENMYTVDVDTMTGALLGNSGINIGFGGLGFAADGTLYGWGAPRTIVTPASDTGLYTVDTTTGAWTLVGGSGVTLPTDTFDINPITGEALVSDIGAEDLYTVDLGTGALTLKTSTSADLESASAFGTDGTYYYLRNAGVSLQSVDPVTGIETTIGNTGIAAVISNLAYNPDDDYLYAVGAFIPELFRFDPNTGLGTNLGLISGLPVQSVDGCLNCQYTMSTFNVAGAQVPEPPTLALIGFGLALIAFRRRQRLHADASSL